MANAFTVTFDDHASQITSLVLTRGVAQVDATATIHVPPSADWEKITAAERVTVVIGDLPGRRNVLKGRPRRDDGADAVVVATAADVEDIQREFSMPIIAADDNTTGYTIRARAIESRRGTTRDIQNNLRTYLLDFIGKAPYQYRVLSQPAHTYLAYIDFLAAQDYKGREVEKYLGIPDDLSLWSDYITQGTSEGDGRQTAPIQMGDAVIDLINETMRSKGDYNTLATTLERYGVLLDAWEGSSNLRFYATASPLQVWDPVNGRSTPIIIPSDFIISRTVSYPDWSNKLSDDWEHRQILIPYTTPTNALEVSLVRPDPGLEDTGSGDYTFGPDSKGPVFYSTTSYDTLLRAVTADAVEREYLRTHTQRIVLTIPGDWSGLYPGYQMQIEGKSEIWRIEGLQMTKQTAAGGGRLATTITAWRHHEGIPPKLGELPLLTAV